MALTSGTKLGPYEIQSPLGAGGMGEVYRAKDTRLDRTVAIKVLPSHLSSDPELKQRMEREARAISALQHAHICTLYDIGTQDGTNFLVMEYLEGQTLAERLEKGALPLDQVLKIGTEIAQALEKAHQQGIIHRDLKPANIMLTKAGAKLMDFGLAKPELSIAPQAAGPFTPSTPTMNLASLTSAASPLTQKGLIVGTFQYMAPELLQGAEADARSDLFSFGCVLYEMITGRRAFEGKSQLSVFTAILEKDPEPIAASPTTGSADARPGGARLPCQRSGGSLSVRARRGDGPALDGRCSAARTGKDSPTVQQILGRRTRRFTARLYRRGRIRWIPLGQIHRVSALDSRRNSPARQILDRRDRRLGRHAGAFPTRRQDRFRRAFRETASCCGSVRSIATRRRRSTAPPALRILSGRRMGATSASLPAAS